MSISTEELKFNWKDMLTHMVQQGDIPFSDYAEYIVKEEAEVRSFISTVVSKTTSKNLDEPKCDNKHLRTIMKKGPKIK